MIERNLPILVWILNVEDRDLQHIKPITRLDIMDGATLNPHPEGLFSTTIFGPFGNELRDKLYGKIDLKVSIMHPKIFRDLMKLKDQYKKIVAGEVYAKFDKKLGDFVTVSDDDLDGQTGYGFFVKHLQDLKFNHNSSISRSEMIDEVEKWRHRAMMKNLIVMPAGLRDIEISGDGRITKNEVNDLYYRVLAATTVIIKTTNMDGPEYDGVRRNLQNAINDIYEHIEGIVGGRRGFMRDKFISRRVMDGTRNVITAMDASGAHLDSPNVPGFDSTVLGLYQSSRALAPVMMNWLLQGPLRKLKTYGDDQVQLIDKKTLKQTWVNINPDTIDYYVSEQGLMELIHRQEDVEARHRPIEIDGHYLALVYRDKESFKVFDNIDDLPDILKKMVKEGQGNVSPITLAELIYYAMYSKVSGIFNMSTRYPTTDDNSIYPTRYYVKTTTTGDPLWERDDNWDIVESKDRMAPEWPRLGVHTYHDSHSPHSGRLGWSQADFDGDTKSSTGLMTKSATDELEKYVKTRNAWVTPDGQMRSTISYDTSIMIFKNLTSRFEHVRSLQKIQKESLINLKKG